MQTKQLGFTIAQAIAGANATSTTVSNERGAVTQSLAQFCASKPNADSLTEFAAGVAEGFTAAVAAGKKVSKNAAQVLVSQVKKVAGSTAATFKTDESDGSIVAFGNGSIRREYAAVCWAESTAIEKVAKLLQDRQALLDDHAAAIEAIDRSIAEYRKLAVSELS